ncbi:MAG: septum formation initiator family protein [wastewater metagenome]|nr:septum formation initiator family protein [Candidatus Loosdrechtia aerotolerans]
MQDGKINPQGDEHFPEPVFFELYSQASKEDNTPSDNQNINDTNNLKGNLQKNAYFGKFIFMVGITSCIIIFFSSFINKTRQERFHMMEMKKTLEKQVEYFHADNTILKKEYTALKHDPVRIEKEAREQLGFTNPDEIVYPKYNFRIKRMAKAEPAHETSRNGWKGFLFEGPLPWQFPAFIILITAAFYLISYHYEYRKLHRSNR